MGVIIRYWPENCKIAFQFWTVFEACKHDSVLPVLRELSGEQGPRSGFRARPCIPSGHGCQLASLHQLQKQIGRANAQFARAIHVSKAVEQETGMITKEEGTKLEGKQYECIHATVVGDGTVGLVTLDRPKALNALSHALMVEVVDALQTFDASSQVSVYLSTHITSVSTYDFTCFMHRLQVQKLCASLLCT